MSKMGRKRKIAGDTATALHRKLWKVVSEYVRTRDCLYTTGTPNEGLCCTCGVHKPFSLLDAGHYQVRRWTAIKYDEHNIAAQCKSCNGFGEGEQERFAKYIERRWGSHELERLKNSRQLRQFKTYELQELIAHYTDLLTRLKEG